jgi:hypothetical protein
LGDPVSPPLRKFSKALEKKVREGPGSLFRGPEPTFRKRKRV